MEIAMKRLFFVSWISCGIGALLLGIGTGLATHPIVGVCIGGGSWLLAITIVIAVIKAAEHKAS